VRRHPLEDVSGTASTFVVGDRRRRHPRALHARRGKVQPRATRAGHTTTPFVQSPRRHCTHRSRRTSTPYPLSPHTPSTCEHSGVPHHTREEACVAADTRLAHWEATKQALHPPPFGTHAKVSSPLEGKSSHSQQHGQELACHTRRVRIPHRWWHHPLTLKTAAHHWEWQHRSHAQQQGSVLAPQPPSQSPLAISADTTTCM